jgi:hypothetical protein
MALEGVDEAAMQPFSMDRDGSGQGKGRRRKGGFFFRPGARFRVRIWRDPRGPGASGKGLVEKVCKGPAMATGELVLGEEVVVDGERVNRDPFALREAERAGRWRERFGEIGKGLRDVGI